MEQQPITIKIKSSKEVTDTSNKRNKIKIMTNTDNNITTAQTAINSNATTSAPEAPLAAQCEPVAAKPAKPTLESVTDNLKGFKAQQEALGKYSEIIREKAILDAKWEDAKKEYMKENPDGDLKRDVQKIKSAQIEIYQDIRTIEPIHYVDSDEIMDFVRVTKIQFKNNTEELTSAKRTRELSNELTEHQQKHFEQPFMSALTYTPQTKAEIIQMVALRIAGNDIHAPVNGSSVYGDKESKYSLYEYLLKDPAFNSVLGTLGRMKKIKVGSKETGDKERKGHAPVFSIL